MALLAEAIVRIRYETGSAGRDLEKAIKADPSIRRSGTDAGQAWQKSFAQSASRITSSDPVFKAFQDQTRKLAGDLGKQVNLKLPVSPETAELRAKLAAEIAELHRVTKLPIPVEAEDKAKFEAELSALAELVSHRVKVNLPVTVNDKEVPAKAKAIAEEAEKTGKINLPVSINTAFLSASLARISTTMLRIGQGAGLAALGTALGSVAAEGVAVAGAIAPAAGAIALIPAAAFAAAAGLGTLALATSGIGAAFKQASQAAAAGGSSMAAAERQVAAAQRESLAAQRDINKARQEAARSLRDMSVQLSGAHIDERDAIQNVKDAQLALNKAIAGQNPDTIARAQLEYDKAQQSLTEVQNRVTDLTADQATAAKKGVEGSDQVQAALDRQRSAADALASAQENLAHQGAGVANAMRKLAPAAQELVRTLLGLKGGFDDVRIAVQQATFAGVAADVRSLAETYLPVLKTRLSEIGGAFNAAIRQAAGFFGSSQTVADISTALHNTAVSAHELSGAVTPILGALRDIGVVGSGFLPQLAAGFTRVADEFGAFISHARETGALQQFIQTALDTLTQLGSILHNVGSILFSVLNAGKDVGGGLLNTLQEITGQLAAFFKTTEGQDTLKNFFATTKAVVDALLPPLVTVAKAIGTTVLPAVADAIKALGPGLQIFANGLADALRALAPAFGPISQIISGLISSLGPGLLALANGLAGAFAALAPAAVPVGRAISDVVVALAPLLPLIGVVLARALTEAATVLSALSRALGPFIGLIASALTGAMEALLPLLLHVAEIALPLIADAVSQAAAAFGPLIPVIIQMAEQFATNLAPFMESFARIIFGQLLPALLQMLPVLAQGLLQALVQIAPHIPAIAEAMGQMAVAGARILVALTPLLPTFVQFVGLIIELLLKSHVIEGFFAIMAAGMEAASRGATALSAVVLLVAGHIRDFIDGAKNKFEALVSFVSALPGKIGRAASGMWDGIKEAFRAAINFVVRAWNSIHLQLPSITIPFVGTVFGGLDMRVPQLPYAAEGALVPARRGGQPVMLGDGGEDEWALGNAKLAALLSQAVAAGVAAAGAGAGGGLPRIEIPVYVDGKRIALAVREGEAKLKRQ